MSDNATGWSAPPPPPATTPTEPASHVHVAVRGGDLSVSSRLSQGRFGRMFRNLPVFATDLDALKALAESMISPAEPQKPVGDADDDENTTIDAGYTYLGQFIDHDITFDPVSSLTRQNDPDGLADFRTPRFDLDSLYGRGPADQPYLYGDDGVSLRLGNDVGDGHLDLQRNTAERALIGDPRNDENLIVSQLQALFIGFHNAVAASISVDQPSLSPADRLKATQQQVRWHYQWIVVHEFLTKITGGTTLVEELLPARTIIGPGATGTIRRPDLQFFAWDDSPYMPVEFSVAAYRFGHSMVRPAYLLNDFVTAQRPPTEPRVPIFSDDLNPLSNLNGFRALPGQWGIDWTHFFDHGDDRVQHSYRIDPQLAAPLGMLPGPPEAGITRSLAHRNLLRGVQLGLPAGQDVARAMGFTPLTAAELGLPAGAESLADRAPLWFYVLREAALTADGQHLGPVGGRIVAEVLIGLLAGDPLSYLNVSPNWTPTLGPTTGEFTMRDLIALAAPVAASAS